MTRKHRPKNSLHLCLLMILLTGMAVGQGCNKETPPAPVPPVKTAEPVKQQAKAVQPAISSTLRVPPAPGNMFDFSTKKDPFKPFVIAKAAPVASSGKRSSLPIHSFDISQFRLIGIITGGKQNQAMVTDPTGKGYVLKVGMTIGRSEGRITSITENGVQVLEEFRDDNGRVRKEHVSLTLPRKQ